jgi:hypothetical protein
MPTDLKLTQALMQKLKDVDELKIAIAFDPDEAEELGAVADGMPEQDVIDAAFDETE